MTMASNVDFLIISDLPARPSPLPKNRRVPKKTVTQVRHEQQCLSALEEQSLKLTRFPPYLIGYVPNTLCVLSQLRVFVTDSP